jgi:hypothetical protein
VNRRSRRKLSGWSYKKARNFLIRRLHQVGHVLGDKLQLLLGPSPDDGVVAIQLHRHRLAVIDLFSDIVADQPSSSSAVGAGSHVRAKPVARRSIRACETMIFPDSLPVPLTRVAQRRSQQQEMYQGLPQELFHEQFRGSYTISIS